MPMPEFKQLVEMIKGEGVTEISPAELREMQKRGEDFSLVDVREPDDWKDGIIPGAQKLSRGVLELKIDQITTDTNRKIVLYCNGGACSALAAHMLQRMGFTNVHSLAGGYNGWVSAEAALKQTSR